MSERFTALDRLNISWPFKFPTSRIAEYEQELRSFTNPTLAEAVSRCLRDTDQEYPPTVATLWGHCRRVEDEKVPRASRGGKLRPGDEEPGRPGCYFLTVDQAEVKLAEMREDYPEAFKPYVRVSDSVSWGDDRSPREKLELGVTRVVVGALERCLRNAGRPVAARQERMFQ